MMPGWRVWLAFEVRPGVTSDLDLTEHWRGLCDSCRRADGKVDAIEYDRWMRVLLENRHVWGTT